MEKGWKERECRTSDYIIHKGCSVCIKYAVQYENSETHSAKHSEIMSVLNQQPHSLSSAILVKNIQTVLKKHRITFSLKCFVMILVTPNFDDIREIAL